MKYLLLYALGLLTPAVMRFLIDRLDSHEHDTVSTEWQTERLKAQRDR